VRAVAAQEYGPNDVLQCTKVPDPIVRLVVETFPIPTSRSTTRWSTAPLLQHAGGAEEAREVQRLKRRSCSHMRSLQGLPFVVSVS
jgi:hypothetical protein